MKNIICLFYLMILFSLLFTISSKAQYFGTNKVKYENFDFHTLNTDYFSIDFYPEEKEATYDAARMLERWNERYSKIWGTHIKKGQPIILYANHPDFEQTNVVSDVVSQGTGGVTEGLKSRITLALTGVYKENDHVLGHELVHAFQYELLLRDEASQSAAAQIPLWFIEGMAEYLSLGKEDDFTAMWMRDAVLNNDIPSIHQISTSYKYFPYRYGQALWAFIGGTFGDDMIGRFFRSAVNIGYDSAYTHTFKITEDSVSKMWQASMKGVYNAQIQGKTKPDSLGERIIDKKEGFNLSPVVSPDGKYIALFTRADVFTLDLYIADAHTGKLVKQVASSASDRHYDALQFINSSGAWSPDSKKFAFVVIIDGDDEIAISDLESGKIEREIKVPGIDEISFLSWSPDGNKLALAGTWGGINDLVVYNLQSNTSEKLTNDKYTELHPCWSPDGKNIAFATDRGQLTNLDSLKYGSMNIGIIDVATKEIKLISMKEGAKHINPQYSPDGKDLYFICNQDGFNDIYKYTFATNNFTRITNVATGISGLTDLSPAISISRSGRMIFSVYYKNDYKIRAFDLDKAPNLTAVVTDTAYKQNSILPPGWEKSSDIVNNYLHNPGENMPAKITMKEEPYSAALTLLAVSQPSVGVAVDRFGTYVGGGISALWGDLLGDHMVAAVLQASGTLKDIGGQVMYQNLKGRFTWGAEIAHIPYLSGYAYYGYDTVNYNGGKYIAGVNTLITQRTFWDEVSGLSQYPLSTNRRIEFSLGFSRISYDVEQEVVKDIGGYVISDETSSLPTLSALNMLTASLAYVGDYSFFGYTSPVAGSRYRVEAQPMIGSLKLLSFLFDYRQYLFANPITFAFRAFHYGRYLGDSEDPRLNPLYLGYDTWIRGYNINSFTPEECVQTSTGSCPEIDRLIGSRIALMNFEVRAPIFGSEQFGIINFPYLPTELVFFVDGGVAWNKNETPKLVFKRNTDERVPVFSTGVAARVNLFGYAVGQVYLALPFQRDIHNRMVWGFLLEPGW